MQHPNEKPVELNQAIIRDITSPDELVVDLFSGSGSLAVGAKIEGRSFLASDLSKTYVDLGNNRVKQAQRRLM
jgi:site-specific DNA-methyltransferase (adenine-specific)